MLEVGENVPEIKVKTHQGEFVSLSDFLGKNVILWFYPKADTPGCTAEGCGFRDRMQQFKDKNTVVLGVSFDTDEENRRFAEKFHFPFPLLCDTDRELGIAFGACKSETDKNAARIGYWIDTQGRVKRVYPKVDAKEFPEMVLKEISQG
jgi:peroxiredoxin Q/BCP